MLGAALLATAAGLGLAGREEMRTSRLQARLLSAYAQDMGFFLKEGPNPVARYPAQGPYNERFGYSALPGYLRALTGDLYAVEAQAVLSPALDRFMAGGGFRSTTRRPRPG